MHFRRMSLMLILSCCCLSAWSDSALAQRGNYTQGGVNYARGNYNNYGNFGYGNSGYRHNSGYRPYHRGGYGYGYPGYAQNYSYGNYTRPYPYHLDYYRMKYGGSYEPYAGNIYGPPLVQQQFVVPNYNVNPYLAPEVVPQNYAAPYYHAPQRNYSGAYYW